MRMVIMCIIYRSFKIMKDNMVGLMAIDLYKKPKDEENRALQNLIKALSALSYEELEAINGEREMTKGMFEHCLRICIYTDNFILFNDIWNDFPELNKLIAIDFYESVKDNEALKRGARNKFLTTVLRRIDELYGGGFRHRK